MITVIYDHNKKPVTIIDLSNDQETFMNQNGFLHIPISHPITPNTLDLYKEMLNHDFITLKRHGDLIITYDTDLVTLLEPMFLPGQVTHISTYRFMEAL